MPHVEKKFHAIKPPRVFPALRPPTSKDPAAMKMFRQNRAESIESASESLAALLEHPDPHPERERTLRDLKNSILESTRDLARQGGLNQPERSVLRLLHNAINSGDPKLLRKVIAQYTCLLKNPRHI